MAAKKDNLPLSLRRDDDSTGTITYANEVIAIIAGVAANEVEGIAGMCTSGGITDVFGRNHNITRGVKVEIGSEEASVDLYVVVEYGTPIQTAAQNVQENVRKAIETMTGLHVVRVDVHVQGVSFEKEKQEAQASLHSVDLEKVTDGSDPQAAQDQGKGKKKGKPSQKQEQPAPEAETATVETAQPEIVEASETEEEPKPAEPAEDAELKAEPDAQA